MERWRPWTKGGQVCGLDQLHRDRVVGAAGDLGLAQHGCLGHGRSGCLSMGSRAELSPRRRPQARAGRAASSLRCPSWPRSPWGARAGPVSCGHEDAGCSSSGPSSKAPRGPGLLAQRRPPERLPRWCFVALAEQCREIGLGRCGPRLALEVGPQCSHFLQQLSPHVQVSVCSALINRLAGRVTRFVPRSTQEVSYGI